MRRFSLLALALLATSGLAAAQDVSDSALEKARTAQGEMDKEAVPEGDDPATAGDDEESKAPGDARINAALTAKLYLTNNPTVFQKAWKEGAGDLPTTSLIGQANPVMAMVIVSGCKRGKDGKCSVTFTTRTAGPDGLFDQPRTSPPWPAEPMGSKPVLAPASFGLRLGPGDPAGRYSIEMTVTDLVAKTKRVLTATVTKPAVVEEGR